MKAYLQQTIDSYNAHAKAFDDSRAAYRQRGALDTFLSLLSKGSHVLDLGCGSGRDAALLTEEEIQVTGLDLSTELLSIAKEICPSATFVEGDMLAMPFADNTFDGVWASASLLHIKDADLPQALAEIRRVLKSEGIAWLSVKQGDGDDVVEDVHMDQAKRYFQYYSEEALTDAIETAGFEIINKEVNKHDDLARKVQWIRLFIKNTK